MLRSLLDTIPTQAAYIEALVLGVADLTTSNRNQIFKELLCSFPHEQVVEILTSHISELDLSNRCNIITQLLEDLAPVDRVEVLACAKKNDLVTEGGVTMSATATGEQPIAVEFAKLAAGTDGSPSMAATTSALLHQISIEAHSSRATPTESLAASMVLAGFEDLRGSRIAFLEALPEALALEDRRDLQHFLEMASENTIRQQGSKESKTSELNQQTSMLLVQADTIPEDEKMPLLEVCVVSTAAPTAASHSHSSDLTHTFPSFDRNQF